MNNDGPKLSVYYKNGYPRWWPTHKII